MWIEYNPNPKGTDVGDCVIRAITVVMKIDWDIAYIGLVTLGYKLKDMPSANRVWGEYLKQRGFTRHIIPDTCPECYTVKDFCMDHPDGTYVLATGSHVIAVRNGDYYDSWDSGWETPIYFFRKG